jgi:hypothetical protein
VGALAAALGSLITFLKADQGHLQAVVFWAFGSFERASWTVLGYPAAVLVGSLGLLVLLVLLQKDLNLLLLGGCWERRGASTWRFVRCWVAAFCWPATYWPGYCTRLLACRWA